MLVYFAGHPAKGPLFAEYTLPYIRNHLTTYADITEVKQKLEYGMKIHLADATPERGQYQALVDTGKRDHLFSYAYNNSVDFDIAWSQQLGDSSPRLLVDSGAFTAYTKGKVIRLEEYAEWALAFKKQYQDRMRSLFFFNLDVIGDEEISDQNLCLLEKMGLDPLPIFTYKGDIKYLKKYIENYHYFALGGLVGKTSREQIAWLDYCFKFIVDYYKRCGVIPKVHLLGVTAQSILERYPCYSSDSSSWTSCLRFGSGNAIKRKKIPRYKESKEALAVTLSTLRAEIRKYQQMEQDITKIWSARGITWAD